MSSVDESGSTKQRASVNWTGDNAKISLDDQLDLASGGFGTFQRIMLLSCILLYIAEGMGLLVTNITWNVMPLEEWGLTADKDYLRGVLVSSSYFGFVLGSLFAGLAGNFGLCFLFHNNRDHERLMTVLQEILGDVDL